MRGWPTLLILLGLLGGAFLGVTLARHQLETEVSGGELLSGQRPSPTATAREVARGGAPTLRGASTGREASSAEAGARDGATSGRMHFIFRNPYHPLGRQVHTTDDCPHVLAWFQARWDLGGVDYEDLSPPGMDVYGLNIDQEEGDPLPTLPSTHQAAFAVLERELYVNELRGDREHLCVLTDDDEISLAWFLVSDAYVAKHPSLAFWLTPELPLAGTSRGGWRPERGRLVRDVVPSGGGAGATYIATCEVWDGDNFGSSLHGTLRIDGVRLPALVAYLHQNRERLAITRRAAPSEDVAQRPASGSVARRGEAAQAPTREVLGEVLEALVEESASDRPSLEIAALIASAPGVRTLGDLFRAFHGRSAYDICMDRNLGDRNGLHPIAPADLLLRIRGLETPIQEGVPRAPRKPNQHSLRLGPHAAQVGLSDGIFYEHWIVFDDVWAGAHPHLADGILRWAEHWSIHGRSSK